MSADPHLLLYCYLIFIVIVTVKYLFRNIHKTKTREQNDSRTSYKYVQILN